MRLATLLVALTTVFAPTALVAQNHDVAFWEEVIASPSCEADEFVDYLRDPRGWAPCSASTKRCSAGTGRLIQRLCGAGTETVEQSACFRKHPGPSGREAALQCLRSHSYWSVSHTIWLEDHGDRFPSRSRFPLSSEPTENRMPETLKAIWPFPPRALGLSEADLEDASRVDEFRRLADELARDRVDAMVDALEVIGDDIQSRSANFADQRTIRGRSSRFDWLWARDSGSFWTDCPVKPEEEGRISWHSVPSSLVFCRADGLTRRTIEAFRHADPDLVPYH